MVIASSTKFKINNEDIASVYASIDFAIKNKALSDDGKLYYYITDLYGWGDIDTATYPSSKVNIPSYITNGSFRNIVACNNIVYYLDREGKVFTSGQKISTPSLELSIPEPIVKIVGGYTHMLALSNSGTVYSHGYNNYGQLGSLDITNYVYTTVRTLSGTWLDIAAGANHSLALSNSGMLWAWGLNSVGQLGDNTVISRSSPVQVSSIASDWESVHAGTDTSFAVNSSEYLWGWGEGISYARGDSNTTRKSTPSQIGTSVDWGNARISQGIAVKSNGTLWAWGTNSSGELGFGDYTTRAEPVQVGSETTWYKAIGYGSSSVGFSLALKNDGTLWSSGIGDINPLNTATNIFTQVTNIAPDNESPNFVDVSYSSVDKFGYALRQTWAASGYTSNAFSTSADVIYTANSSFTVPEGIPNISVVAVGGGAGGFIKGSPWHPNSTWRNGQGGAGGSLVWGENIPVVANDNITIGVGSGGSGERMEKTSGSKGPTTPPTWISGVWTTGSSGGTSFVSINGSVALEAQGGIYNSNNAPTWSVTPTLIGPSYGGGNGGLTSNAIGSSGAIGYGGGGAGGWTGPGGISSVLNGGYVGGASTGGGGGGGGSILSGYGPSPALSYYQYYGGSGGGVGLYGPGPNGAGGEYLAYAPPALRLPSSNGIGRVGSYGPNSNYGGGGGGGNTITIVYKPSPTFPYWISQYNSYNGQNGNSGAVRITYGAYSLITT